MNAETNPALRATLERVISEERVSLARVLASIRLWMSAIAAALGVWIFFSGETELLVTSIVSVLYFVVALTVWVALRKGWLVERAGWVVTFLDTPMIAVAQIIQIHRLPIPLMGLVTTVAIMFAFVVLSTLSLSRGVIISTSAIGLVPFVFRALALEIGFAALLPLVAWIGITATLVALVGRIRTLVHTARAQDFLGKYLLGRRLGSGGMAEVFEAVYSPEGGLERRVALKRIHPSQLDKPEAVELFRREAALGAQLNHPGVVQVLDYGKHKGTWFMAMEFVDGISLKELLVALWKDGQTLTPQEVTSIAWQLADALDYVHTRTNAKGEPMRLVHRDLNPPNIMLTRAGEVKLADFGIAVATTEERLTATGIVRGKLGYTAPEQLTARSTDGRADLFALGATLWECLVGERLFVGASDVELLRACLDGPIAPPSTRRPGIPEELDRIVMGLLDRDLQKRTPSAAALRRELLDLPPALVEPTAARHELSLKVRRIGTAISQEAVDRAAATKTEDASLTSTAAMVPSRVKT